VIRFQCTCGKSLKVDDSFAGRKATCPHCGRQVRVPADQGTLAAGPGEAEPKPLSGPAALQAALRDGQTGTPADEIPTAEVVAGPLPDGAPPAPQAAQAIKGLDALAKAAGPAPAKPPTRPPAGPKARGRNATRKANGPAIPNGRQPPVAAHSKNAAVIGVAAAVVVLILALIAASFIGGDAVEPEKKPADDATPTQTVGERPRPKRYAIDQPGALFGGVGEVDENDDDTAGQP
jgi:hypothetical protein